MNYQHSVYEPKSPRSMQSPLDSVALFKKTKRNGWEYKKNQSRTPNERYVTSINLADFVTQKEEKVCRIKTRPKSNKYRFPNGLHITGIEETKRAGRAMGYSSLVMGCVRIKL